MKTNLNLFQIVSAVVFVLWTMGKVPYGINVWLIPFIIGSLLNLIALIADHFA